MSNRLIIIGAGGFGREVYDWACDAAATGADWTVAGFLDDNPAALDGFDLEAGIVGSPLTHQPRSEERFVCAIGEPLVKLRLARHLERRGAVFTNVVHPTASIGRRNCFGVGVILCPGSAVTTNVTLGDHVSLNLHATVGHDAVVGAGCTINAHADVTGGVQLGEGVFLGSHASVLPQTRVGDYARIGAGSTAIRSVRPETTVIGVPGRRLRLFEPPAAEAG